jgi:methionyl-tRNA formyltransferase
VNISVASSSLISLPIIDAIQKSKHTLASIITNPDKKSGRGQQMAPNELATWAESTEILVAKPADNSELNRHLLAAQPQLIITAAYGKLIPVELLHGPRFGWLNLHFSLLPKWRGAAPVQWALLSGDEESGISIFKLDKGMDTGPIYLQESVTIHDGERTPELLSRLSQMGGERIMDVIEMIATGVKPKAQPATGFSLAPKISKEMGQISWESSTIEILRKDQAIGDKPGIWSNFRGERIVLHEIGLALPNSISTKPGSLTITSAGFKVQCGDGCLEIAAVTPAGKKRMSASEFVRGARFLESESFDEHR